MAMTRDELQEEVIGRNNPYAILKRNAKGNLYWGSFAQPGRDEYEAILLWLAQCELDRQEREQWAEELAYEEYMGDDL